MSCTAEQIALKKREAQEKLKQRKCGKTTSEVHETVSSSKTSPGTAAKSPQIFYGGAINSKTNELTNLENKIKNQLHNKNNNRILSQPYSIRDRTGKGENAIASVSNDSRNFFAKVITCCCEMINEDRFEVVPSGYHAKLIEIFKTITTGKYDRNTKIWSFCLKDYDVLQERVNRLNPDVLIGTLPKFVLTLLRTPKDDIDYSCLSAIEPKLIDSLMGFQKEGVCYGIDKHGRCMIADDMGLGKTYQALAIADFYKDDWPLLICTTATTRNTWADQVRNLLPWVPCQYITVLTATQDYFGDAKVLIVSYSLMERNCDRLMEKKFGFLILDESHALKNHKTKSSEAAIRLAKIAKRVVLLTGTPALSRPSELFSQLELIDSKFFTFREYSIRYCAAKQNTFGWDTSGQSNLNELNVILKRKFMIRRTKEDVEFELGEKSRETILLDPSKVWNMNNDSIRESVENLKEYSSDFMKLKGRQREEVLLKYYSETSRVKADAVCSYVKGLVREKIKFIVFAHHQFMLNAISDCLKNMNVDAIRIDGTTKNDLRSKYINHFQKNDSCRVAVLSLKACNSGITLTAAKMVIFAELDWNPSTLAQAESRAHRIGQTDNVSCRYLLAKGTADDVIWEMLKNKQNVLNKAGLFSEDLSDATHSAAPVPEVNKVSHYFDITPKKQQPNTSAESTIEKNAITDLENCASLSKPENRMNELKSMLDDSDDDTFLNLDF